MNSRLRWIAVLHMVIFYLISSIQAGQSQLGSVKPFLQAFDDGNWSDRFYGNGIHGTVYSVVKATNGDIYVGGDFKDINGDTSLKCLAKWDGNSWSAIGGNIDGAVKAMLLAGDDLYIGGWFKFVDGIEVNNIACWNGLSWSALDSGVVGTVSVLAMQGTDLYAGGQFYTASGISVNNIAKWDGNTWSTLGSGVDESGYVNDIEVDGSVIYVGGYFYTAGGITVNHIAKWDGNTWSAMGSGMEYESGVITNLVAVSNIGIYNNEIYTGGGFKKAGGVAAAGLAKWDGNGWSALIIKGNPADIEVNGGNLYILLRDTIQTWNGISWSQFPLDLDMNPSALNLLMDNTDWYISGYFNTIENIWASKIAKWDGNNWTAVGKPGSGLGLNDYPNTIATLDNSAYVGGKFITADGQVVNMIARWDGNAWYSLANGIDDVEILNTQITEIMSDEDYVYAAGNFNSIGGVPAAGLARWDGSSWSEIAGRSCQEVATMIKSGGDLYIGGTTGTFIERWDGSAWHNLGSGLTGAGRGWGVSDIAIMDTNVIVCGTFYIAGKTDFCGFAKWDGYTWTDLRQECELDGNVQAIEVVNNDLYVFGSFEHAGGVEVNGIARWDGQNWYSLGSGFEGVSQYHSTVT